MVKLLKTEFDIFALRKTLRSTGDCIKAQRTRTPVNDYLPNKNIKPDRTKDNIFLKPKDDRTYGERADDRLEAGYRES